MNIIMYFFVYVSDTKLNDHSYNARRGRRRKATAPSGVVTRRGKNNNSFSKDAEIGVNFKTKKSSADVYEFKEDSEDEVKRPRLILTIKNPVESTQPIAVSVTETSVITECKPVVPNPPVPVVTQPPVTSAAATKNSSANTRKSRRLQVCSTVRTSS